MKLLLDANISWRLVTILIAIRAFPPKIIWLRIGNCSRKYTADLLIRSKQAIEELWKSEEYGLLEIF